MPEIAEVERLGSAFTYFLRGTYVEDIELDDNTHKVLGGDLEAFRSKLLGRRIDRVNRKGKHLVVFFNTGGSWRIHLGSTGWFSHEKARHTHYFLHPVGGKSVRGKVTLSDDQVWYYSDSRIRGTWALSDANSLSDDPYLNKLGPDWILSQAKAQEKIADAVTRKRKVRDLLLDQYYTSGLGAYLACEALWRAGIHPHSRTNDLGIKRLTLLSKVIPEVIDDARKYPDHSWWGVFTKKGETCVRCETYRSHTPIAYLGNATYHCPHCQRIT